MSWLRNLQGQLTELANEVLSEATEEVADPESELQVAVKKAAEAEKQLMNEKGKIDLLEKRCANLEQNLLDSQTELEMGRAKFENIISSRDRELKKLRIEIEQLQASSEEIDISSPNEGSDKTQELLTNVQNQIELLREQKESEILAIMEQHSRTIQDLRESYEEKLRNLEASFPASTSQSGISIIGSNAGEHPDLSAVHDELENLALTQSGELQCDSNIRREEELQRLQTVVQQLTSDNLALSCQLDELKCDLAGYESLKRQTQELTRAYNDLNTEYETYKENNGGIAVRNQDLVQRIDTLRANLIEYEERYEQCRREHSETEKQLQQLTEDFSILRDAVDKTPIEEDLLQMKEALDVSKTEGNKLKNEVKAFRDTVVLFEGELEDLRIMNKRLVDDNEKLSNIIREIQNDTSNDKYAGIIHNMKEEADALKKKNTALEEKLELMDQYQSLAKDNETGEREKTELLEEKIILLEQVRDSLKERVFELESQKTDTQSLDSLIKQLREALAANSEKTEECERLRAEVEEHKKEINIRQGCVDDLIVQNNLLQVQYQEAADQMHEQRPLIAEKEKQILKLQQDIAHIIEEKDALTLELENLRDQVYSENGVFSNSEELESIKMKHSEEIERIRKEHAEDVSSLQNDLKDTLSRVQQLQSDVNEAKENPNLTEYVGQLQAQNEELRKMIAEKHEESVSYYSELQHVIAQLNDSNNSVGSFSKRISLLEEEIKRELTAKEALQKDLARLKAHLIHMEESTTAEAIEAEKREMDLRALVAELQKSHHSVSDDANEHLKSLELRVAEMALRLEEAEKTSMKYKTEAEVTEKLRQETAEALQSLQGILREISGDHEKESASLQHINEELSLKVSGMTKDMADLRVEIDQLKFEKQACEDEVEAVLRDTSKKQRLIDDLENQMEELKSSTQKGNCEYRIDDSTLRSLFLSYFLAANDKKPDIAILLANILQYSKEDIEKISSSFFPNGKSIIKSRNTGGLSLTEQFVRFLENESESSKTAPQLPVDRQSQASLAADMPTSVRVPPSSLNEILK